MRTKNIITFLFLIVISIYPQNAKSNELTKFTWLCGKDTLGVINIPPNFKINNWQYGEGLVTTLTYKDSSRIILHFGGTIHLPLLDTPFYKVINIKRHKDKTIRKGIVDDSNLFWCEYNFKDLVNIAYAEVPNSKIKLFNSALSSFIFLRH